MKKILSIVAALVILLTSCTPQSNQNQNDNKENGTEGAKVTQNMSEEEKEEAWKKEPMYGKKVKLLFNGGLCTAAAPVATVKGFYEEEGVDVEIVSGTSAADALGTGKAEFSSDHIATLLVPAANGVKMVFGKGLHSGCKTLFVKADSEYQSTEELKGKDIAIHDGIGGSDHNICLRFLNHDNIKPEEVNFKVIDTSASMQALENGEIQATLLSDQFAIPFVKEGKIRPIRSITTDEDFKHEPCCVLALNSDFVEQNPVTSEKIINAVTKSSNWIEDNKEEFCQILLDNDWLSIDKEDAVNFAKTLNFKIGDDVTKNSLEEIINDYKKFEILDNSIETEKTLEQVWNPVEQ